MDMIRILAGEKVTRANGDEVYWVHLIGDAAPSSLALTGADVEDMADDAVLAAGSTLRVPGKKYVLYEDGGTFVEV